MEIPLPLRSPLIFTTVLRNTSQPMVKPFVGFLPARSIKWRMDNVTAKTSQITASAGFSKKKRRKNSTPRSKDPTLKGLVPKTQVTTGTKKKDQKSNEENEGSGSLLPNEGSNSKTLELAVASNDKEAADILIETKACERSDHKCNGIACETNDDKGNGIALEASSKKGSLFDDRIIQDGNSHVPDIDGHTMESKDAQRIIMNEENVTETGAVDIWVYGRTIEEKTDVSPSGRTIEDKQVVNGISQSQRHENMENASHESDIRPDNIGNFSTKLEQAKSVKTVDRINQSFFVKPAPVNGHYTSTSKVEKKGDVLLNPKPGCEENLCNDDLHKLAEDSFKKGNKIFHYPELVKPDQQIEMFFNRSFSSLKNEHDIMIVGAFNDWKWKPFTTKLSKSYLNGDWWSCKIRVPKEAYKIDFVFNNGKDVYDNNYEQDFCIMVNGGMDEFGFENFLLQEKRREQEEVARQKAEKARQEEEQRRMEADRLAREADRTQAREEVEKRRGMLQELMKNAVTSVHGIWYVEPREFKGNDVVRLYYNRNSGPLSHAQDIWIHAGHDKWKDGPSIVAKLIKSQNKDGDWWYAEFVVPDQAVVLDWVFADGTPKQAVVYDNNHNRDFHAIVPASIPKEPYWVQEEQKIFKSLQVQRHLREKARRAKAEKTARMKAEMKEKTLNAFLLSQKHIVYTDPFDVQAGSTATLFYNPANTVLNGKTEIWLRYSFNRWTHPSGLLPPQRMIPAENGSHLKAIVKVPLDAYVMDFVFSEKEDGGIYDNKNCMDYHIPVHGGVVQERPLHIVHISVEMAPIAKVGGLGDVVTSLSRAIQDMNHNVNIILPKYDCLNYGHVKDLQFHKSYSLGCTEIKVWTGKVEGLSVYFLEPQNGFFWAGCIYGCVNDAERFGLFCRAALEFLLQNGFNPDIIHCHDWSTAPVAWLFREHYMNYGLNKAHVIFTIHNLEFGPHVIGKAMACAEKSTTVSPTYAKEVSGNPVISPHLNKFHGIINGIDPDIWDPYNDKFIPVSYTSENVVEGKKAAKDALQQRLGMRRADDRPLVGIITRLTHQKGIHLIKHAIWRTMNSGGQVVLLGSAPDPQIQNDFVNLTNQLQSSNHDCARLCLTYDEPLSHLIYAGADFILVPSLFEPCGLTQLIAMRYGSIPVVRRTGGLHDTVFDVDHDKERAQALGLEPNGFSFDGADATGVDYGLNRAINAYHKRDWFIGLCKRVMEQDWSWNKPALDYLEIYHSAARR